MLLLITPVVTVSDKNYHQKYHHGDTDKEKKDQSKVINKVYHKAYDRVAVIFIALVGCLGITLGFVLRILGIGGGRIGIIVLVLCATYATVSFGPLVSLNVILQSTGAFVPMFFIIAAECVAE